MLRLIIIIISLQFIYANPPDWEDDPGAYEFTATISGLIILNQDGSQMGDDGDLFAAFDEDGNVRGTGLMLFPPFGPYQGTPVFEVQLRSNAAGDLLSFKYYDASEDAILDVVETYEFVINDILGDVINPIFFNIGPGGGDCVDDDDAVSPFDCANAVESFGCDMAWGESTIGELCPESCGLCGGGDIEGCMDDSSCNYNPDATVDDGSCLQNDCDGDCDGSAVVDECGICDGDNSTCLDCAGVPNGDNIEDNCGECDSDPYNDCVQDCAGEWGGSSVWVTLCEDTDGDGYGNPGSETEECVDGGRDITGGCDLPSLSIFISEGGSVYYNSPEEISGFQFNVDGATVNSASGGDAEDAGFMISNSGSTVLGFSLTGASFGPGCGTMIELSLNGTATGLSSIVVSNSLGESVPLTYYIGPDFELVLDCSDEYPDCSDNFYDCAGECGGSSVVDECAVCGGDNSTCADCDGVPNGNTEIDECGICGGDSTSCMDCAGVPNGTSWESDCGCVDANNSGDDCDDCAGIPNGDAIIDDCGVCNGGNADDLGCGCFESGPSGCDNACGSNLENDDCGVCNGDNSSCSDCAGVPNGSNIIDNCGVCVAEGDSSCVEGCDENWYNDGSEPQFDTCGVCGGDGVDTDGDGICDDIDTCVGVLDSCEVCNGLGDIYECGCADIPEGDCDCAGNVLDECGVCGGAGSVYECGCEQVCLQFDNVDPTAGTLDILYSSGEEISGFQFNLTGITITGVSGVLGNISFVENSGFVLGIDFEGNTLPAGSGTLLQVEFIPTPINQNACITNGLIGGPSGVQYTLETVSCIDIDPCDHDCADVCSGEALVDDCGVCSGGTTGVSENGDQDCNGDCFGEAVVDECGVCAGGNTATDISEYTDENNFTGAYDCGGDCFGEAFFETFYADNDGDGLGGEESTDFCNTLVPDGWVDNSDDADDNCTSNYHDCVGDCDGTAFIDDCEICSEGNSGHTANSDIDECGDCFGYNAACSGCMDPMGLNYDPEALVEDGSCEYIADIFVTPSGSDMDGDGTPGAPFRTIQAGIDASEDGDSILVMPGTYYESVEIPDKEIVIFSDGGAENTIIDNGPGIFGDGSDGDLIVGSGDTYYTDEIRTTVVGENPAGQNTITVDDASGFEVGDEILILTMGDAEEVEADNDTGQWETRRISAISGSTLTLDIPLTNTYSTEFSGTFEGVFNTSNNGNQTNWTSNRTVGYEIVFYEKIEITKLKVFRYHENWSLWDRNGNLLYRQEFPSSSSTSWREYDLDEELIIEPGEYKITAFGSSSGCYYRNNWGDGDYYQSFRHGVVEYTAQTSGNAFPNSSQGWFRDYGFMVDFEYELADPVKKHQVIRVPQFQSVENSGTITANDWDGSTGGAIFFRVAGELVNNGSITTTGLGYRGGDGQENYQYLSYGWRGEGIYGVPEGPAHNGQFSYSENRNQKLGAGGGASEYGGGGGSGYGSIGETGDASGGYYGDTIGSVEINNLYLGSGGGSGGNDTNESAEYRRKGGDGGGLLTIFASSISNSNLIQANGEAGQSYYNSNHHGGGGGAGGSIWLVSASLDNSGSITATGGDCNEGSYFGGDGGVGRIRVDYDGSSPSGSFSPSIGYNPTLSISDAAAIHSSGSPDVIIDGFTLRGDRTVNTIDASIHLKNIKLYLNSFEDIGRSSDWSGLFLDISGGNVSFENVDFNSHSLVVPGTMGMGTWITMSAETAAFSNCDFSNLITEMSGSATSRKGGVIYQSSGSTTYDNCTFSNNSLSGASGTQSELKGGVYYLEDGEANFENCSFTNNVISGTVDNVKGGVFYVETGDLTVDNSTFQGNSSTKYGGVGYIESGGNVTLVNVQLDSNNASNGGAIYSLGTLTLLNTQLSTNSASSDGGAIYNTGTANLFDTQLSTNTASSDGGAIYNTGTVLLQESLIDSNDALVYGGGVYSSGLLTINLSEISQNESGNHGGGLWLSGEFNADSSNVLSNISQNDGGGIYGNGTLNMTFTEVNDNHGANDGGGIWWGSGQVTAERSDIRRNSSNRGGGVFILAENPIFQFDVIALNDATTIGGGMYISKSSTASSTPIIFNSTVVYNTASVLGSGILCTYLTNPVIQNSILWSNLAADGVQVHLQGGSEIFITYSDIAGGLSGVVGFDDIIFQDNIDAYPDFVNTEEEDYSLLITSPCIDAGNPNAPIDPDGTIPDQGAYYFAQDGIPNVGTDIELLDFGGVATGESGSMELPIYNTGLSELAVVGVIIEPDNFIILDSSFTVASMATYNIVLLFEPDAEGIYNGSITLLSNDPDEGEFSINLHGAGDALEILSVLDVPDDQGGAVVVRWHRNVFDGIDGSDLIDNYRVWREYDEGRDLEEPDDLWYTETLNDDGSTSREAWEFMGELPAQQFVEYALTVSTVMDSTESGIPWTTYLVSAHTADPLVFFESQPGSGYSVDNLAPSVPTDLNAMFYCGNIHLDWSTSIIEDFNYYTIYRSDYESDETEILNYTITPSIIDDTAEMGAQFRYFVTATDFSGNESPLSEGAVGEVHYHLYDNLHEGPNLLSFYFLPEDVSTSNIMGYFGGHATGIIGQGIAAVLSDGIWIGTLSELNWHGGYWVILDDDYILEMTGCEIEENINYPLVDGFNLISYLGPDQADISTVIPDEHEPFITQIVYMGSAAIQVEPFVWIGSLEYFSRSAAYWLNALQDMDFHFDYSGLTRLSSNNKSTVILPDELQIIQSTNQAFYFVEKIEIDGEPIKAGDIVLSYCDETLSGSRFWEDEWIDIPVMGIDGNNYASEYCKDGQIPNFKVYIVATGEKIDLTSDTNIIGWTNMEFSFIATLSGSIPLPTDFSLDRAYPNPFNPTTTLSFAIPVDSDVSFLVYNLQGREVAALIDGKLDAGYYSVVWNADSYSSGVYFVKMVAGEYVNTQKLMLVK